jgi:hypothetical protein
LKIMAGRIGRILTVVGLLLLSAAWLWWLYLYGSSGAIGCIYLPHGACPPVEGSHFLALPPYQPAVLWAGAVAVLLGAAVRLVSR